MRRLQDVGSPLGRKWVQRCDWSKRGLSNIRMIAWPNLHLKTSCMIWYPRWLFVFSSGAERHQTRQNYQNQTHGLHHHRHSHHRGDGILVILCSKKMIGLNWWIDEVWIASFPFFSQLVSEQMGKKEFWKIEQRTSFKFLERPSPLHLPFRANENINSAI